jgi:hypothetical protein
MATEWSAPIWRHVTALQYLQFPWRTLFLPALFMPLLGLFAFECLSPRMAVALIGLAVLLNLSHTQPKGYQAFDDEYFSPASIAKTGYETTARGEYTPRWVRHATKFTGAGLINQDGKLTTHILSLTSVRHEYTVTTPTATMVMEPTYYYPGWVVLIDGQNVACGPEPAFGTLTFVVPAGQHSVSVELRPTAVRRAAVVISIVSAGVLLIGIILSLLLKMSHLTYERWLASVSQSTKTARRSP